MIDDIEILFGEERPKRAKKRERIKKKHTKKLENIRLGFIFLEFLPEIQIFIEKIQQSLNFSNMRGQASPLLVNN